MNEFKITCSIAKAYEKSDGKTVRRFIGGLASGTQVDLEGERMAESAIEAFQKAIRDGVTLPDGQWSMIPLRSGHRHEWDDVLGYIVSAEVDKSHNLWIEAELDQENPVAMSLYKKLTRNPEHGKPVKLGLSVGGSVIKAGWEADPSDPTGMSMTKVYYDVDLREVSVVSQPAYPTSYLYALSKSVNWDALESATDEALVKAQDGYQPTAGMKSAAKRALAWKDEGRAGGTRIGLTRANQIVNGENLSVSTVKRMYSFFSRHEVDKKADGFSQGEEGYPSPGRVAWDLWGGDAGFSWSTKIVNGLDDAEKSAMLDEEIDEELTGTMHDDHVVMKENTSMEEETNELEKAQETVVTEIVEEVQKTDAPESEPTETDVEKSGMDNALATAESAEEAAEGEGAAEANLSIDALATRLNALTATVEKIAAQLGVVRAATEVEESEQIEKAKTDEPNPSELIKAAVLAAMEPVIERLDRLENEPVDKSYAVLRSKYADDEPFEVRIQREIDAVDGRDAVKRALELAFKS